MAFDDIRLRRPGTDPLSFTGMAGPTSYNAFVTGVNNRITEANKYKNLVNNFRSNLASKLNGGAFSTTNPFSSVIQGNPNAPTSTSSDEDIFSLVDVNKDPSGRFDNINKSLLDKVADFKPDYGQIRNTSADALSKLNLAQGDIDANRADTNSLIDKFNALSPKLDEQTLTQTNALNRVYDGGLKKEFSDNTEYARNAERRLADRSMRMAQLQDRLGGANGASSSYAKAALRDATGRIATETAARDADRRRQDTASLLAAQERNLGRVQDLNEKNLLRSNIPIDARTRILDQEVNLAVKRLGAAGQAASIEQLTDELSTVGRQLGLTGQALQNYLATHFFGVKKEGDDYPLLITGGNNGSRPQAYYPNGPGGSYDDDGGPGYRDPNKPPPTPDWVNRLRKSQGWQQDANGNYTIPGRNSRNNPGSYNLTNDFDNYGDPNSPLYYPGYSNYQPGETDFLQDYYENPEKYVDSPSVSGKDEDLMDFYSGEYNW